MNHDDPGDVAKRLVRMACRLLTIIASIILFQSAQRAGRSESDAQDIAVSRFVQAAKLAGLPPSGEEQAYFGTSGHRIELPASLAGSNSDQIAAASSLSVFFSARQSDAAELEITFYVAFVSSLIVVLTGVLDAIGLIVTLKSGVKK